MSSTTLVTGAAGFVGSHLLQLLTRDDPSTPIVAWRRAARASHAAPPRSFGNASKICWRTVDLLDQDAVRAAVEEVCPTAIYHLAGVAGVRESWRSTVTTLEGNVRATHHLLDAAGRAGRATRVVIPGTALVYKPSSEAIAEDYPVGPVSPYGVSKLAQEMLGQHACRGTLQVILTRSFTHLGPGQEPTFAASSFAHQIARIESGQQEPVLRVGFLGAKRDLTDVRDTACAYVALMERGLPGQPYNVCTGKAHRMEDVLEALIALSSVSVERTIERSRLRPKDNLVLLGDPRRIGRDIGWKAETAIERTLEDTLDYWRSVVRTGWQPTTESA